MSIFDISVSVPRYEYAEYLSVWDQVDDCIKGQKWVKDKETDYLPQPNADDKSNANKLRYQQYLFRALYMNATGRTLDAMVGMVFVKPPKIELPTDLEYLLTDADGNGLNLVQHAHGTVEEVSGKGRYGILVDFPSVDGTITAVDRNNGARPYMVGYTAQNIINWRVRKVGAVNKLCMVVLREQQETLNGYYQSDIADSYRVLWLDDDGYYNQATFNVVELDGDKSETQNQKEFQPTDANGQRLTEIPFRFIGSKDNDYTIDQPPLYDISCINLSHYQNSADNEESSYLVGQPTLNVFTSKTSDELAQCNNGCGVQFGSRTANIFEPDDKVELIQAQPNNLPKENMKDKESMMAQLGARLIFSGGNQTAEAARINYGAETAQLSTIVDNVNAAYEDCIRWCSLFSNGNENPEFMFHLNDDFFHERITPQEFTAWVGAVQSGQLPAEDFYNKLRRAGEIEDSRTDQDILDDIDTQEPII